jgi:VanZ family protein
MLVVVLWLAFTPRPPPTLDTGWDKLNHALAFGALALSGRFGFPGARWRAFAVALGLLALGVLIEAVQSFLPARSSELYDVLADGVGIVVGLAAAAVATYLMRR